MITLLILMPKQFSEVSLPIMRSFLPSVGISCLDAAHTSTYELFAALTNADFLVWSRVQITEQTLRQAPKWGAGIDGIDLAAARQLGILVTNVPGGNATAVAEHFFALLFALSKRICAANAALHAGQWAQSELLRLGLEELAGKTLGIVGLGHIGQKIAQKAVAFEMNTLYRKRNRLIDSEEFARAISYRPLPDLLEQSDVVCITLPLTAETNGLFNYPLFKRMKQDSWFINVSRGAVVNESDLCHALGEGIISAAGLDVFESEPLQAFSPLIQMTNVVLTPHIAGRSKQAMAYITEQCTCNVLRSLSGNQPCSIVEEDIAMS